MADLLNNFDATGITDAPNGLVSIPLVLSDGNVEEESLIIGKKREYSSMHYKDLSNNYCFVPVGVESFGSWGTEGRKLVKAIGRKVMEVTGEKRSTFFLFQRISMAIQRGNASMVIGTVPRSEGLNEIFEFITNPILPDSQ